MSNNSFHNILQQKNKNWSLSKLGYRYFLYFFRIDFELIYFEKKNYATN